MSRPLEASPVLPTTMDSMDSLLDFSEYDNASTYQSPALSTVSRKTSLARTTQASVTPSLMPTTQGLSGPSHQYDQYKQQTGFVPGALASTYGLNQSANVAGYTGFGSLDGVDYLGINADGFDFATQPSQGSLTSPADLEMDFDSPTDDPNFLFPEMSTINPTAINSQPLDASPSPSLMSTNSHVRVWPGMHQQAAALKAQAQQRQQQQILQQQQQARQNAQPKQQRAKGVQPADPIVEQKITQLLNSMRAKPASPESQGSGSMGHAPRIRKMEEDMDEDEKLLASEEGKKLTSKERRQLRNKVSARAFRSRRKEYITQLEAEIAGVATENQDMKIQNRALVEENKRLSDLTRMLLSSPSFSDFLDQLSSNPQPAAAAQAPAPVEQARQAPKDPNPYAAQQQQQIGLAMIPEQSMDFSMIGMDTTDAFSYRPQVYAVPEIDFAPIDASILSGKESNFVGRFDEEEKVEMPVIEHPAEEKKEAVVEQATAVVDEDFENDELFALYHDDAPVKQAAVPLELNTEAMSDVDLFSGVESEKALARYELVGASEEEVNEAEDAAILARVQRIVGNLEAISTRLDRLSLA